MTLHPLPDADARHRAVTRFDCNLAVTAGAGTGKTSLLVERFLNLVLSRTGSLAETTAITFTEKAATEMKGRVAAALESICEDGKTGDVSPPHEAARSLEWLRTEMGLSPEEIRSRAREDLDDLDSAFIGTIHAFCSDILRRHPLAAGIPPEFAVDDGIAQHAGFDELWLEFLGQEFGSPTREDLWREVLSVFTESEIEDAARSLALCPQACDLLAREGYRPLDGRTFLAQEIATLRKQAETDREDAANPNMRRFLGDAIQILDIFSEQGPEGLHGLTKEPLGGFWEQSVPSPGAGTPKVLAGPIKKRGVRIQRILKNLRMVDERSVGNLLEALRPFARKFRTLVHDEGILSYDDLLLITRNLFTDHPYICRQEAARNRFVLVDEFQDTDPLQYDILFLLAGESDGAQAEPGRLFVVGDPKQSIYRFRGADISAYLEARNRIVAGNPPVSLVTNFRSRPGILSAVNRMFTDWMGPASEADRLVEPEYETLEPHREPKGGNPCVEIWSVDTPEDAKIEDRRQEEARQIAAAIRRWNDRGEHSFGDVAVLFRSLIDIPIYVRALRDAGIDFVVDGGKAFSERQEVVESFALLRALANPADTVALLAVLRSPLGGVPDGRILSYVRKKGRLSWKATENPVLEEFPEIRRAFSFLGTWNKERRRTPLDRWVMRALTESEFLILTASHFEGAQRAANVRKLAEMIASLIRERGLTLEQAVDGLEEQFGRERAEGESPLADEAVNAVRILSMHKAKGLEYPVVLLPDLGRVKPSVRRETKVRILRIPAGEFLAIAVDGRSWLRNTAEARAKIEDGVHEKAEDKRILYVAATRAEERLILINSVRKSGAHTDWTRALEHWDYRISKEKGGSPFPPEGALAKNLIRHRVMTAESAIGMDEPGALDHLAPAVRAFHAAGRKASGFDTPRFRHPSGDDHAEAMASVPSGEEGTAPMSRSRDLARAAGAAVHRLLENWDFRNPSALREPARRVAAMTAPAYDQKPSAVEKEVEAILDGFLGSALPRRLSQALILGREVPLLYRDAAGTVVYGYADLIYREGGAFHIADYKTDDSPTPERAEAYRTQLEDYGAALQRAWSLDTPPVLEVLFLRTGESVRLDPSREP